MTLLERLIAAHESGLPFDGVLQGDLPRVPGVPDAPAAVLVAMTQSDQPDVVFIQRPETMRNHAGQIAFPGGKVDAEDADHASAALREAQEEIGLDPALVTILGEADTYRTITSFCVTPILATIPVSAPLVANPDEVDAILRVPLGFLLNPENHNQVEVDWEGEKRHYYEMQYGDIRIWGATAGMIVNMTRRLSWYG